MPVSNKTKSQGASFRTWFSEANTILSDILGLSALDMGDYLWRDDFESDLTPKEGIEGALEYWEEDFSFSLIAEDIRDHLANNHYPPIDAVFVASALEAISRAEEGDWESLIDLPNGKSLPVSRIIEDLHLGGFIGIGEGE